MSSRHSLGDPIDPPGNQPARLLVVEDDGRVRRALVELLGSDTGITVVGACGDAGTARRLIAALRPDIVLVDLLLPKAAIGLALVAELSRDGVTVVAMSVRDGMRDRALSAGAITFVQKDGDSDVFIATVLGAGRGKADLAE